jgi:hypothetical protein
MITTCEIRTGTVVVEVYPFTNENVAGTYHTYPFITWDAGRSWSLIAPSVDALQISLTCISLYPFTDRNRFPRP